MYSLEKNWRLWVPLVSGLAFSRICPVSGGERVPQTPPQRVFPIVWTILYACIGYSWKRNHSLFPENTKTDVMHGILVCLLCAWLFMYACKDQKVYGFYVASRGQDVQDSADSTSCMDTHCSAAQLSHRGRQEKKIVDNKHESGSRIQCLVSYFVRT